MKGEKEIQLGCEKVKDGECECDSEKSRKPEGMGKEEMFMELVWLTK